MTEAAFTGRCATQGGRFDCAQGQAASDLHKPAFRMLPPYLVLFLKTDGPNL